MSYPGGRGRYWRTIPASISSPLVRWLVPCIDFVLPPKLIIASPCKTGRTKPEQRLLGFLWFVGPSKGALWLQHSIPRSSSDCQPVRGPWLEESFQQASSRLPPSIPSIRSFAVLTEDASTIKWSSTAGTQLVS
ncbi:hypothetical protein H112_05999 [Trichophyton rubrum D6]|uniref:Uncharacterized protein n=3 Tax=Trichophyton TaxID=5550 RepID=A0A178EQW9_TRIRU|nr:hypothetical protein H100_06013 [Trichophyton rubrum MR850]EZF39945.1 hypothetical protein H102_05982 [Trichophyton rubrum CBS 100081]EZF50585.1 hypothetical protein H103_06007 [Trichophyton rubrum CBS 288.86]EZF61129.1 hypothetical protein H104_05995 [Trichophyton rubrum CBS 289.86]EZF71762.1 hypothetical protein H105_06022 [Trichophyton soudanense CBS 452.61]EZF82345.1 hypothetical protein H110_06003 [Trichophyton rubrum MR1448]EZF93021.1 hypothetical protein H113_06050 [Trichophyton rub